MFVFAVFDSKLALATAIACTSIIGFVFLQMSFSYTKKRANRQYAQGRQQAPSVASFRTLSKFLFVSSMLLTLASYWIDSPLILRLYDEPAIRLLGAAWVLIGYISLKHAFTSLGDHYSPLFDAHLPAALVTTGCYRLIRHPIYLFNLFVSFGLSLTSGSGIVLANAAIGLLFIINTIRKEERYLKQHFPDYKTYAQNTWRLLPYIY